MLPTFIRATSRRCARPCIRELSVYYAESHEFINVDGGVGTVGITAHAANALGDVVFIELPEVGAEFEKGESFGSVESVKAAGDVYVPVTGEVIEINEVLEDAPGTVNESPMENGWFLKMKISNEDELSTLMNEESYNEYLATLDK